jgi:hypothetical protein
MQSLYEIRKRINSLSAPQTSAALLFIALNLFFVFNFLAVNLRDLNLWDESVYINTGKAMFEGTLPVFARNPLVGLLYALTYIPYQSSPFWLVQSATLGRIILFVLMWISAYLVGKELARYAHPLILPAFVLIFPIAVDILTNPSDALFAAMSGFTFWQVLQFYHTQRVRNIWGASLFISLAALSRNDGLVSFAILTVLVVWLAIRFKISWQWMPALILPFVLLIGGYQLLYGSRTGNYSLGTAERTYVAFQQGQELVYVKDPECRLKRIRCAVLQAEKLYGSGEENHYSIFRAIANNPQAYSKRLMAHVIDLPPLFFITYGQRTALFLLFFAMCGLAVLVRKKQYALLFLFLAWMGYLSVYFLTFFREGYIRTPFFLFFAFGAIGLQAVVENLANKKVTNILIILLTTLTLYGWFEGFQALYFTTIVLLIVFLFSRLFTGDGQTAYGLLLFFIAGLMLHPAFEPPIYKVRGEIPEEQGVLALVQNLPPGSQVASGAPGAIWMARMEPIDVADLDYENVTTPEALYEQFKKDGVDAIYVDHFISNVNREIWRLIIPGIGKYYDNIYTSLGGGDIQIYILK